MWSQTAIQKRLVGEGLTEKMTPSPGRRVNQESRRVSGRRVHLAGGTASSKALHSGPWEREQYQGHWKYAVSCDWGVLLEFSAPREWDAGTGWGWGHGSPAPGAGNTS